MGGKEWRGWEKREVLGSGSSRSLEKAELHEAICLASRRDRTDNAELWHLPDISLLTITKKDDLRSGL